MRNAAKDSAHQTELRAWTASLSADRAAGYAMGRRAHRNLSHDELTEKWVEAFTRTARWPNVKKFRSAERELASEFKLRCAQPPYHRVRADVEQILASMAAQFEALRASDPREFQHLSDAISLKVANFFAPGRDDN